VKKRDVNGREIIEDIRLGLTDDELMEKYRLTTQGLRSLFTKLHQTGLITGEDFQWRPAFWDETITLDLTYLSEPDDTSLQARPFIRVAGGK
jgi:hypothetical protein